MNTYNNLSKHESWKYKMHLIIFKTSEFKFKEQNKTDQALLIYRLQCAFIEKNESLTFFVQRNIHWILIHFPNIIYCVKETKFIWFIIKTEVFSILMINTHLFIIFHCCSEHTTTCKTFSLSKLERMLSTDVSSHQWYIDYNNP